MTDPNTRVSVTEAFADGSVIEQIRKLKVGKQDKLVAGPGIEIAADGKTISTDAAAPNWGQIEGELSDQADLNDALVDLQTSIEALEDEIGAVGEAGTIRDDIDRNAQEILTKANDSAVVKLSGSQSISGNKTFINETVVKANIYRRADTVNAKQPATAYESMGALIQSQDVNGFSGSGVLRDRSNTFDRVMMYLNRYVSDSRTDSAYLDIRMEANGTVNLILRKTINGVSTSKVVDTL